MASLIRPAIAFDSNGYLSVADANNHRIQKFTSSGTYQTQWGSNGSGKRPVQISPGIAIDNFNNVYVSDRDNYRIQQFTSSGAFTLVGRIWHCQWILYWALGRHQRQVR